MQGQGERWCVQVHCSISSTAFYCLYLQASACLQHCSKRGAIGIELNICLKQTFTLGCSSACRLWVWVVLVQMLSTVCQQDRCQVLSCM